MKILITGANGYIGAKVVKYLCDKGIDIIATDISNSNIDERAKYIQADIFADKDDWFTYFEKPDVCLHFAWRDGFIHNSDKHMLDLSYHYKFITNLIYNGLKRFATMGSMHEVGYYEGAITENTPCNPLSQYGIAKNSLRKSLEVFCAQHDCKLQWIRAFYVYGDDLYGNSIFCKIRQSVKEGKKIFPFTTGKNKYDFIKDTELAMQISMIVMQDKINGIINACSGIPISLGEQIEWYIKENNLPIRLDYGKFPDRPYDSPCLFGDNVKIKKIMEGLKNE